MIRGIFTSVVEGVIKRFSATGRCDETIENREYFQHYGFTSMPHSGAETIIIANGNQVIAIASDDRRYRIVLENGEVALYDSQGQFVHLMSGGKIEALALTAIKATAPTVEVVATTKVTMTTPLVEMSGNLVVTGKITAANVTAVTHVADANGAKTMASMRATYNGHHHATSTTPTEQM